MPCKHRLCTCVDGIEDFCGSSCYQGVSLGGPNPQCMCDHTECATAFVRGFTDDVTADINAAFLIEKVATPISSTEPLR